MVQWCIKLRAHKLYGKRMSNKDDIFSVDGTFSCVRVGIYVLNCFTGDVTDLDIDVVVQSLLTSGSLLSWKFVARKLGITEGKDINY